jgi:hypothetical protein
VWDQEYWTCPICGRDESVILDVRTIRHVLSATPFEHARDGQTYRVDARKWLAQPDSRPPFLESLYITSPTGPFEIERLVVGYKNASGVHALAPLQKATCFIGEGVTLEINELRLLEAKFASEARDAQELRI